MVVAVWPTEFVDRRCAARRFVNARRGTNPVAGVASRVRAMVVRARMKVLNLQ